MPPDLPTLGRLRRWKFSLPRAYTYKISRSASECYLTNSHKVFHRAYRGLCGLFADAGCRNSSHYGQQ